MQASCQRRHQTPASSTSSNRILGLDSLIIVREYLLLEVSGLRLISALSIILDAYNDKPDDQHIYLLKAIFHDKKHLFKGLALENKLSI